MPGRRQRRTTGPAVAPRAQDRDGARRARAEARVVALALAAAFGGFAGLVALLGTLLGAPWLTWAALIWAVPAAVLLIALFRPVLPRLAATAVLAGGVVLVVLLVRR